MGVVFQRLLRDMTCGRLLGRVTGLRLRAFRDRTMHCTTYLDKSRQALDLIYEEAPELGALLDEMLATLLERRAAHSGLNRSCLLCTLFGQ